MTSASICTIGDEILIGQVVDTNSSRISRALGEIGIRTRRMLSIGDDRAEILDNLRKELSLSDIVVVTGGLGPTKDDITKDALRELSGSAGYYTHEGQLAKIHEILASRGLDVLDINRAQALVPDRAEVILNRLGTAPVMVFRMEGAKTLYALPGVPFEAEAALPDVLDDIRAHYPLESILHRNIMVYGMAESALSKKIEAWEMALPPEMHLAYLPDPLTGIRLRLSLYGAKGADAEKALEAQITALKALLGPLVYADQDDRLEQVIGRRLKAAGKTLSAAESCTGGEIAHLITGVPGSSAYFLGSVTSYAISVKEQVLGVPSETIEGFGVVSSEVAAAMAEGVRKLTGSDYSVATTGLAGPDGDGVNPVGTVWVGVASARGSFTKRFNYKNDRKHNIQRFAASALDFLRQIVENELNA